ncbi:hypothetical protein PMAC_001828 [Pneumocystis sp. 'macacae']|nr:hypothetical protein PMAC_001828 [Pneumocystis sp. 'macacae']
METESRQQKLEAAKRRMNEVKKKMRVDPPLERLLQVEPNITDESKSSVPSTLTENTQRSEGKTHTVCRKFIDEKEPVNITEAQAQKDTALNEYIEGDIEKISKIDSSLDRNKLSVEESMEQNENLQTIIKPREQSGEKESNVLNEQWDARKSVETMENTVTELKSQISFLQKSYLEINEKLNTILLKMDANEMILQKEKEAEKYEKINQLEEVIKNLEEKLENIQYSSQGDLVSPKIEHSMQSQGYDHLSFEDISLNTVNISPMSKQGAQSYYKTCKIDLRKTGGCIGCSGDIIEI